MPIRIVNGDGTVAREYRVGKERTGLVVRMPYGDGQSCREPAPEPAGAKAVVAERWNCRLR